MNYDEFAVKIKSKYPEYKDMDNQELTSKMLAKYPRYQDMVSKTDQPSFQGVGMDKYRGKPDLPLKDITVPLVASAMTPSSLPMKAALTLANLALPGRKQDIPYPVKAPKALEGVSSFLLPKTQEEIPNYLSYMQNMPQSMAYGAIQSGEREKNVLQDLAGEFAARVAVPKAIEAAGGLISKGIKNIRGIKEPIKTPVESSPVEPIIPAKGKTPKVISAVVSINGKLYEGINHNDALAKAMMDGVPQKVIDGINKDKVGMFRLSDGSIITRQEAAQKFGISHAAHSEDLEKLGVKQIPKSNAQNKYVIDKPFDVSLESNDKGTARTLREQFSGIKDEQIVRGNQFSNQIKQIVPDLKQRQGMFWYKAAKGDINKLTEVINDPAFKEYIPQLKQALNLSDKSKQVLGEVGKYYDEAGQVSKDIGTISNIRENYMNRIYKPEPPTDFVKTELKQGLKQTTKHSKARVFETELDAVKAGKKFATTDIADALSIHNEEMARVNTSRKLADSMDGIGIGAWKKEAPQGWSKVGSLQKTGLYVDKEGKPGISASFFYAPKGIAKGLEAITDPDFTKKIDIVRGIQRYQGLVKTIDLSYSFFHHFTMAAQTLYQGGLKTFTELPIMGKILKSQAFAESEQDFVRHTGMTTMVEENRDVMRKLLSDNKDIFSKVSNAPVIKQALQGAEASRDFLFNRVQRYMKVSDYGNKISNWIAKHPNATNQEVTAAKIGIAKEINNAFGGLNWEALGISKSNLSVLRGLLLAPDWTISNVLLATGAFKGGTEGPLSRRHIATALLGGMILTEGINKILTGHFTDKNPKGHFLEINVAPDVYVSLLRGGIGDLTKLMSMGIESGPLAGSSRFLQGKLAPIPRTAIGLMSGTKYTGVPISKPNATPLQKTTQYGQYILQNAAPMPFGIANVSDYLTRSSKTNTLGKVLIASGLGRYSKSKDVTPAQQLLNAFKSGDKKNISEGLTNAIKSGDLTKKQIVEIYKKSKMSDIQLKTISLDYKKTYELYKNSSDEDKKKVLPILIKKMRAKFKDPSENDKKEIKNIISDLGKKNKSTGEPTIVKQYHPYGQQNVTTQLTPQGKYVFKEGMIATNTSNKTVNGIKPGKKAIFKNGKWEKL